MIDEAALSSLMQCLCTSTPSMPLNEPRCAPGYLRPSHTREERARQLESGSGEADRVCLRLRARPSTVSRALARVCRQVSELNSTNLA